MREKLIKYINEIVAKIKNKPPYLNKLVKLVSEYDQEQEILLEALEMDLEELTYHHNKILDKFNRLFLLIRIQRYIKFDCVSSWGELLIYKNIDSIPWTSEFMEWVIFKSSNLTRRLTIEQSIILGDKYDFLNSQNIKIDDFKQLHEYKII